MKYGTAWIGWVQRCTYTHLTHTHTHTQLALREGTAEAGTGVQFSEA